MNLETKAALHDSYAAGYDNQVQAYNCHIAEILFGLHYEFIQHGQNLLDLGIGSGLSALLFAKAGMNVSGMDFSAAMLKICQSKKIVKELKQHDLQQAPWPYPPNAFDHLNSCGVLHFIPSLEIIFSEAKRVLRKDGIFAFTTKAAPSLDVHQQNYETQIASQFEIFSHSPDYLESLLDQHSFERLKMQKCFVGEDIFSLWIVQKKVEHHLKNVHLST